MHLSTGEKNNTFGGRLAEERERLGFSSQTALGNALGGTSKKTIINWEHDITAPDVNDLMRMHSLRFNIVYLLFGATSEVAQEIPAYTPAEHAALAVRALNLNEADAKMVVQIAKRMSEDRKG
jgi:transcriptional regulator with XRE-family HTH domain